MDRTRMQMAAKLLDKARSTEFEAEAIALVDKSYRLLAGVITSVDVRPDPTTTGPPRRERRLVQDRRAHQSLTATGDSGPKTDPAVAYGRPAEDLRSRGSGRVDLIV